MMMTRGDHRADRTGTRSRRSSAVAITVCTCGGALRDSRIASNPSPPLIARSGASGTSTSPRPIVGKPARMTRAPRSAGRVLRRTRCPPRGTRPAAAGKVLDCQRDQQPATRARRHNDHQGRRDSRYRPGGPRTLLPALVNELQEAPCRKRYDDTDGRCQHDHDGASSFGGGDGLAAEGSRGGLSHGSPLRASASVLPGGDDDHRAATLPTVSPSIVIRSR